MKSLRGAMPGDQAAQSIQARAASFISRTENRKRETGALEQVLAFELA